jgi:cell wall-associated NlpC family hydrolase
MIELVPIGQDAVNPQPGDIIFCHRKGFTSRMIRFFEHLIRGDSRWSHVAVVVKTIPEPMLVEALTKGVELNPLSQYRNIQYGIFRAKLAPTDQAQAVAFALSCVGQQYGWGTIFLIGVRMLSPHKLNGTEICSGLGAQTLVRGWANFATNPAYLSPSVLAEAVEQNDGS